MRKIDTTGRQATYDDYLGARGHGSTDEPYGEISARLASAQFAVASQAATTGLQTTGFHRSGSDDRTPTIPLVRALTVAPMQRHELTPTSVSADTVAMNDDPDLPLPATWYNRPATPASRGISAERHALLIRASAAVCLTTAAGLLFWLNTMGQPPAQIVSAPQSSSLISSFAPPAAMGIFNRVPSAEAPSQEQISTAQILAVAERFVANGDVLAARAMLQDRAGLGEPRALFALAETYDPHMLASWAAKDAVASITYARFLYEAARRGGVAESQTRLEALK
jgi:hypothetical protein